MTTFLFLPSSAGPFRFQPTLDDNQYTGVVTWNMVGERYYLSLFSLQGERVLTLPLIGSLDATPIQALSWAHGFVNATTLRRHGYTVGATMELVVRGCAPVEYNGTVRAFITGLDTFQYQIAGDPGVASQFGLVNYDINIVAGYFDTSKLVFRESAQAFEVTP